MSTFSTNICNVNRYPSISKIFVEKHEKCQKKPWLKKKKKGIKVIAHFHFYKKVIILVNLYLVKHQQLRLIIYFLTNKFF